MTAVMRRTQSEMKPHFFMKTLNSPCRGTFRVRVHFLHKEACCQGEAMESYHLSSLPRLD